MQALSILVVDDDPVIGAMLLELLDVFGHRGRLATSGVEALELLQQPHDFDLVMSDLRMPQLGGQQLWERLRESQPELAARMIFISAEQRQAASCQWLEHSGHQYLQKPFDINQLRSALQSAAIEVGERLRRCG